MKGAFLTVIAAVAILSGVVGLFAWSPWESKERQRELAWVEEYLVWSAAMDEGLFDGQVTVRSCEARFEKRVGQAPTRLRPVEKAARDSCRAFGSDDPENGWWNAYEAIYSRLLESHRRGAGTTLEVDLSRVASSVAGRKGTVHCWLEEDWTRLTEQSALLRGDELWAIGLADARSGRIDLSPVVCDPLRLFLRSRYTPFLNLQSYQLAEALVTLAHEAEHLRHPEASEDVVECYALQRVRAIVGDAERRPSYQEEMAGLAWEVGYPNTSDEYRTEDCRNGGPLDLHPRSQAWP